MEQCFDFLAQLLSDNGLRAEEQTMEHHRETILQREYPAEFVHATKSMDIVALGERHEADLKDALGLGLWLLL
jgi:hypothetical protein